MGWRKQQQKGTSTQEDATTFEWTATDTSTAELDDILDEIDSVLEINAEEFVKSFVQKGGQ